MSELCPGYNLVKTVEMLCWLCRKGPTPVFENTHMHAECTKSCLDDGEVGDPLLQHHHHHHHLYHCHLKNIKDAWVDGLATFDLWGVAESLVQKCKVAALQSRFRTSSSSSPSSSSPKSSPPPLKGRREKSDKNLSTVFLVRTPYEVFQTWMCRSGLVEILHYPHPHRYVHQMQMWRSELVKTLHYSHTISSTTLILITMFIKCELRKCVGQGGRSTCESPSATSNLAPRAININQERKAKYQIRAQIHVILIDQKPSTRTEVSIILFTRSFFLLSKQKNSTVNEELSYIKISWKSSSDWLLFNSWYIFL